MRRASSSATANESWRANPVPIASLPELARSTTATSWTTMVGPESTNTEDLYFTSLNSLAPVTVVMIHILLSSHLEWAHCWTELNDYHLLLPDLPAHSRSRNVGPFSFELAADRIADMIRKHARNGQAHLVGISTGGYISLEIIKRHPDIVMSTFISGASVLSDLWTTLNTRPMLSFVGISMLLHSPKSSLYKATGWAPKFQTDELLREIKQNCSLRLYEAGTRDTAKWARVDMVEVGKKDKRIALVSGGKQDNTEGIGEMGKLLQSLGTSEGMMSRAFVVRDAIHAWNLQMPLLFAKGIRAWIEKTHLPGAFEPLE
ncbi:alpha/beta-hydrolase [Hypoxylon sp. NC1633]|nr:alpha/beta-hydrolase [Hypoxylon sp. NC1633]